MKKAMGEERILMSEIWRKFAFEFNRANPIPTDEWGKKFEAMKHEPETIDIPYEEVKNELPEKT